MMTKAPSKAKFGRHIRDLREEQRISLRKFAAKVGMSPTYLSKVERGDLPPPGEEKIVAIARHLDVDPDDLLARADRIPSDLLEIIRRRPRAMATLLRAARKASDRRIEQLIGQMH